MNIDEIKGKWTQIKGDVKSQWGELTDDEIERIDGDAEKLVGVIQEKYGKSKEDAKAEINTWLNS